MNKHTKDREPTEISLPNGQKVPLLEVYQKTYTIRREGSKGLSYRVTIPKAFVEKEARKRGLTVDEFLDQYQAIARYNSFRGLHIDITPRKND